MGIKYLWDTNTVIYFLQQQFPASSEKFIDKVLSTTQPVISAITEIELLCWKASSKKDLGVLYNFINDAFVIELEKNIKLKTVDIRKATGIKLPDAIIATTALVHHLTLVTRNTNDFKSISGLKLLNPFEQ